MVNLEHVRIGGKTGSVNGTQWEHIIVRNRDGGRETSEGSGGWVSLSDL